MKLFPSTEQNKTTVSSTVDDVSNKLISNIHPLYYITLNYLIYNLIGYIRKKIKRRSLPNRGQVCNSYFTVENDNILFKY